MANVTKRAVSLPKELSDRVADAAQAHHLTYSGLIREALVKYFKDLQEKELEKAYKDYYTDPKNAQSIKEQMEMVHDFSKAAEEIWPEY